MEYASDGRNRSAKLVEGWLEHKSSQDNKWKQYWCILRGCTFYVFTSQETIQKNHVGTLSVGSDTRFIVGDGDAKKGFRFDLVASKKHNKFKTSKFSQRELWRAYITGVATGVVPPDVDLLPGQIQEIEDQLHHMPKTPHTVPLPRKTREPDTKNTGDGFISPTSSLSGSFEDQTAKSELDMGGPMMKHRFYLDPNKVDSPTWFFETITRDIAEKILTKGRDFGNTLMRESITFRDTGSYVITKRMDYSKNRHFNHFEVIRVAEGFKINVENEHKPMICLSEIMEFFVSMSGSAATRPMITNDLKKLGLENPDYQTKIFKSYHDVESGEDEDDRYEPEDYEVPVPSNPLLNQPQPGSQTWNPSKVKEMRSSLPHGQHGYTVSHNQQKNYRTVVNLQEVRHRVEAVEAAEVMRTLDSTIAGYSGDINDNIVSPPPPCNKPPSKQDFYDQRARRKSMPQSELTEQITEVHSRWQKRTQSVPNIAETFPKKFLDQQVPVPSSPPGILLPTSPGPGSESEKTYQNTGRRVSFDLPGTEAGNFNPSGATTQGKLQSSPRGGPPNFLDELSQKLRVRKMKEESEELSADVAATYEDDDTYDYINVR